MVHACFFVSYIRFDVWVYCKWHTKRDSHINNAIVKVNFKFFTIILKIKQTFRSTLKRTESKIKVMANKHNEYYMETSLCKWEK